jgi:hypothetical protein
MIVLPFLSLILVWIVPFALGQTTTSSSSSKAASTSQASIKATSTSSSPTITSSSSNAAASPPDVYLNVPKLSVGRIELDVDNLSADINLNANVASLVNINAGVQLSIQTVNLTISDVDAQLELIVRLGHLVDIVNRVFSSLDLNPLLITAINNVTSVLGEVVGAVEGLLGTVTNGGKTLSFLVDNLGNIVQQVTDAAGNLESSIVGNYLQNMTFTGQQTTLAGGLIQKVYSYAPLNALVNIVFNSLGQIVQATVQNAGGATSSIASIVSSTASVASGTPAPSSTSTA